MCSQRWQNLPRSWETSARSKRMTSCHRWSRVRRRWTKWRLCSTTFKRLWAIGTSRLWRCRELFYLGFTFWSVSGPKNRPKRSTRAGWSTARIWNIITSSGTRPWPCAARRTEFNWVYWTVLYFLFEWSTKFNRYIQIHGFWWEHGECGCSRFQSDTQDAHVRSLVTS